MLAGSVLAAENYRGAEAVLAKSQATAPGKDAAATPPPDSPEKMRSDLKAFGEQLPRSAPAEAARGWIDLALRYPKVPRKSRDSATFFFGESESDEGDRADGEVSFANVLRLLPPPAAWPDLRTQLENRTASEKNSAPLLTLRFLADWLTQNEKASATDLGELSALRKGEAFRSFDYHWSHLNQAVAATSDDGALVLDQMNGVLAQAHDMRFPTSLELPDIVSVLGETKARDLLVRALQTENIEISISEGIETKALARKIVLEKIGELKTPPWSLVDEVEAGPLYEALAKKYPETTRDDYRRRKARDYYLVWLIASHRTDEAAELARKIGTSGSYDLSNAFEALEESAHTRDVADYLHNLLAKSPDLPLWEFYVDAAAKSGETDAMLQLARESAARPGLTGEQRLRIQLQLRRAYLAADNLEAGLDTLRSEIREELAQKEEPAEDDPFSSYRTALHAPGLTLIHLGIVLQRDDLITEGERAAREIVAKDQVPAHRDRRCRALKNLSLALLEANRGPEAEEVLQDALAMANTPLPASPNSVFTENSLARELLAQLAAVYYQAQRWPDVLAVFEKASQWRAVDLAKIYEESVEVGRNDERLGLLAARALAATGHKEEAERILQTLLDHVEGYDSAFELLLELKGAEALPRLDELQARDQFEERPLIWKAKLLFDAGKLEEAEKAARAAIAIDPSDGEEGPGRRMRAYAILADVLQTRGDAKEAENLRGVVTAIRHSEDADRFYAAGLLTRAIKMYEESLTHFANAYCIQSRLALRLSEEGNFAAAEEHYRRAYELMPQSFGRVESHCFGCEKAFAGERAQSLAEKVFIGLAAQNPTKPQVHYLLGYLRMEENRLREALPEFRKAVELDPQYLNAWKQMAEISKKMRLPPNERAAIQLKLLQLDPLSRHSEFAINEMPDMRVAWNALEVAAKARPEVPATLWPLPASTAQMQKDAEAKSGQSRGDFARSWSANRQEKKRLPAATLAQHRIARAVSSIFDSILRSGRL